MAIGLRWAVSGLALAAAGLLTSCAMDGDHTMHAAAKPAPAAAAFTSAPAPAAGARAQIITADRSVIGAATLTEGPAGVLISISLKPKSLTPGFHGLHFHAVGDCSDDKFMKSGAHKGHGGALAHGLLHPQGSEAGDLPNLFAPTDGPINAELFSPFVSLTAKPGRVALLDTDGAALVIHANPDDHVSQPIGGAGPRVGCGVIVKTP